MDGCVKEKINSGGGGGTLRDCNGSWTSGFSVKIGAVFTTEVELWALIHGLRIA